MHSHIGADLQRSLSGSFASTSGHSGRCPQPHTGSWQHHRSSHQPSRSAALRASSQSPDSGNSFPQSLGKLLRRVQSNTPIVGLLSKLVSPTGLGVDETSYAEYCRGVYNRKSDKFNKVMEQLEDRFGRPARPRYALLLMWMAMTGAGLVPQSLIMATARRIRVTFDMEIEIDRFESSRNSKIKEYGVASKPVPQLQDQLNLTVDALCQLLFGVPEGKLPKSEEVQLLRTLILSVVDDPGAPQGIQQALLTKPSRLAQKP